MRGVLNAVEACARTPSFEKLIFSSSLAASIWNERNLQVNESCWSDVDYCRKFKVSQRRQTSSSFSNNGIAYVSAMVCGGEDNVGENSVEFSGR